MWRILQQDQPEDYVIATGVTTTVREFVRLAFLEVGIVLTFTGEGEDEKAIVAACNNPLYQVAPGTEVVSVDKHYYRPTEVELLIGDPRKAKEKLNWQPAYQLQDIVKEMVEADLGLMRMQVLLKEHGYNKTIN
jgi:GDPmannose 4,6-dehydratase